MNSTARNLFSNLQYGGPQFQVIQQVMNRFAEAIEAARVDVVPRVVVGGAGGSAQGQGGGNLMEGLLAMLLSERMGVQVNSNGDGTVRPEAEALRNQIRKSLVAKEQQEPTATPALAEPVKQ